MIEAVDQKKQDLKAIKKGKGKSSKGTKKRRRQEERPASDDEVCSCLTSLASVSHCMLCTREFSLCAQQLSPTTEALHWSSVSTFFLLL